MVIFDFDGDITADDLIQLRRTPAYRYTAFYAWDNVPESCEALLDGVFDEQTYSQAKQMSERIASCEKNDDAQTARQDINVFICRYLFARKEKQLLPQTTCYNPYSFSYPLVEVLSEEGTANEHWYVLNALVKREYL